MQPYWLFKFMLGNLELEIALLHNRFDVNIIFKNLKKNLGLRKPKPTPFVVRMAN